MSLYKDIKEVLSPSERRQAFILFFLMLFSTVLEVVGVALVVPLLVLMTDYQGLSQYAVLGSIFKALGSPSQTKMVIFSILVLGCFYCFKTCFLTFVTWRQNKYIFAVQASLSLKLIKGYMFQPWTFHLQNNSAKLITNVTSESNQFAMNILQPAMFLFIEGSVLVGMFCLLLYSEPVGAMSLFAFFSSTVLILRYLTRNRTVRWGALRQHHEVLRLKHLHQGLNSVKDVKLLGREQGFLDQYNTHNQQSASYTRKQRTITDIPRFWIEMIAVFGLFALVLAMLFQGKLLYEFIPTLGIFAAAAFRLMPSFNRLLVSVQGLRYGLPVIQVIRNELNRFKSVPVQKSRVAWPMKKGISLENISYRYPGSETNVLNKINLTIKRGSSVGFVGTSGAGKSTVVDIIIGLLEPTGGQLKVDDINIQSNLRGWQEKLGYVSQAIYLTDETLRRNIAFGVPEEAIDDEAVKRAMKSAQLEIFVKSLPEGWDTIVGERGVRLSGGQRQRIGIARALYHDPEVLVLDEATSALDMATEAAVMKAVDALHGEKTLLIIAHRLSTVAKCDWIYRMEKGDVVDEGIFEHVTTMNSVFLKENQVGHEVS